MLESGECCFPGPSSSFYEAHPISAVLLLRSTLSEPSRRWCLLLSPSVDVRSADDVICLEVRWCHEPGKDRTHRRRKRKHMNAASRAVAARFHVSEHTYLRSEKTLSAKAKTCGGSFGSNADRPVCVHTHRARTQCSAKRRAGVMIVTFMLMLLPDQRVHERVQRCDGEGARRAEHTKDTRTRR